MPKLLCFCSLSHKWQPELKIEIKENYTRHLLLKQWADFSLTGERYSAIMVLLFMYGPTIKFLIHFINMSLPMQWLYVLGTYVKGQKLCFAVLGLNPGAFRLLSKQSPFHTAILGIF